MLNDLSPAATFISANYNIPFDVDYFEREAKKLLADVKREIGWMYETLHSDGETRAQIQYTVWSETLNCQSCVGEVIFTTAAMDKETKRISKKITCPHCGAEATKEHMDLIFERFVDPATGSVGQRPKRVPAIIVYKIGTRIYTKHPDQCDLDTLTGIASLPKPKVLPTDRFPGLSDDKGWSNAHNAH